MDLGARPHGTVIPCTAPTRVTLLRPRDVQVVALGCGLFRSSPFVASSIGHLELTMDNHFPGTSIAGRNIGRSVGHSGVLLAAY